MGEERVSPTVNGVNRIGHKVVPNIQKSRGRSRFVALNEDLQMENNDTYKVDDKVDYIPYIDCIESSIVGELRGAVKEKHVENFEKSGKMKSKKVNT